MEAPTGIGKSHIARALSFKYGYSFIITVQKGLQNQYCVSPETRVLTSDLTWIAAGDLQEGDVLLGFDEYRAPTRRGWKPAIVERASVIMRPCYRLYFEDGSVVTCSSDHLWLTYRAGGESVWVRTEDVRACKPRRATKVAKVIEPWERVKTWEGGYIAAAFDGEGHISQSRSFHKGAANGVDVNLVFSQKENIMLQTVREILTRFGISYNQSVSKRDACVRLNISGRSGVLRVLGMFRPIRLLHKLDRSLLGMINPISKVAVIKKEFLGELPVVALSTSTRTFIAEGFAAHNCTDFNDMYVMKGRSAYPCHVEGKSCDQGPCRVKKRKLHDDCAYSTALVNAMMAPVVVHNFDSFYYQSLHIPFGYRELMVIDECFIGGTPILTGSGYRPINTLSVGDDVVSWDEHTRKFVMNKIVRVIKRKSNTLLKVTIGGKSVFCTSNHKFFTGRGWVEAKNLLTNFDIVGSIIPRGDDYENSGFMYYLRAAFLYCKRYEEILELQVQRACVLFRKLFGSREECFIEGACGFGGSPEEGVYSDVKKQSDARPGYSRENADYVTCDRALSENSRRKWKRFSSPKIISRVFRVGCGGSRQDGFKRSRLSGVLQDRCSERGFESWDRSGRPVSQRFNQEGAGLEKSSVLNWSRVEGVTLYEPRGVGELGGVCPESVVYDLEIEGTHTYIAEGFIVHNCHNIEGKFLSFMEFTISNRHDLRMVIPEYSRMEEYDNFLETRLKESQDELAALESSDRPAEMIIREMDILTSLINRLERYFEYKDKGIEYVFDRKAHDKHVTLTVRPVMVGGFVREYLLTKAQRVLMMSATILDKKIFCESSGIKEDECEFIRLGSIFPARNRPIFLRYAGSMNRDDWMDTLPGMVDMIIRIIGEKFSDSKGIIHTHSDKIMKALKASIYDERLTFRDDFQTVDDLLQEHATKPGSIIVASGLREGLDLKDDLSRFQIICKIPYPDMGDKRVKRRMALDRRWYSYMTALMLVQMFGRSVRSETDKAATFILDDNFVSFWRFGGSRFIPEYIKDAIIWR